MKAESGSLNLKDTLKVSKDVYEEYTKNHRPTKNDIVMSRVGTYGVIAIVNLNEEFCLGQNTVVIHSSTNHFLYCALNSNSVKSQIEEKGWHITKETLKTRTSQRRSS